MFPTSDEFYCPLRFSLNSDCFSVPGKLIDGQVLDFDEVLLVRWKLVIGDLKVCVQFFFKNVAIYWSCGWKLGVLDLTQNWFEIVFQAFDFSSQKNRLVMIEWNCQFHNLMTWPHLLVEVISWVLVSVLYGGLRTCSVVSPFETSFSKSPCRRGLLGLLLFTPLWQSFA
jgi:hypothetical protein